MDLWVREEEEKESCLAFFCELLEQSISFQNILHRNFAQKIFQAFEPQLQITLRDKCQRVVGFLFLVKVLSETYKERLN